MSDLFRQEVARYTSRRLDGEVFLGTGATWSLTGYIAAGVAVSLLIFASCATYARKESVPGWIIPHGGILRVAAQQAGIIETISVHEGDIIKNGSVLAKVKSSTDTMDGNAGQLLEQSAQKEIAATNLNAEAQIQKLQSDSVQLQVRYSHLQSMHKEAVEYLAIIENKASIAKSNFERAQSLNEQGYLSKQNLESATSAWLEVQQQVSTARTNMLSLEDQIAEIRGQISASPIVIEQSKTEAQSNAAALNQKLQQIKFANNYTITAPISGRVMAVPVETGQNVSAGTVVFIVTPENSHLEAELYAPSKAAGFIKTGQEISLQYQAFPYQKFGSYKGHITSVSKTVLSPGDVAISGLSVQEPVFRVRVKLDKEVVSAYGVTTPLQPGMLLNADIIIDRRTLIEWLLDPIYAVGKR